MNQMRKDKLRTTITHTLPRALTKGILLLALTSLASLTHANWYQVEVILFAQSDISGNEQNLKSVQPGYPERREFLDSGRHQVPSALLEQLSPRDLMLYHLLVPPHKLTRRDPLEPEPFATLPASERLMNAEAASLERSGQYQVLFHQAWRQTLGGPRTSPWVIIQGGARVGEHHELEGSLRIYSDTQMVAQTRLWRSRFDHGPANFAANGAMPGEASARETGDWPSLPPPPRPPEPQLPAMFRDSIAPVIDAGDPSSLQPPVPGPTLADLDMLEMSQIINTRELHYLDHPRLGALIRVVRYEPEDPQASVEEEAWQLTPMDDTELLDDLPPMEDDEPRD